MKQLRPALFICLFALSGFCQSPTAEVTGHINDTTGAAVPGTEVQITNVNTGARWQTMTNDSGNYSISLLPPSTYRLTVSRSGFKTLTRGDFDLVVSQVARLDFTLEVGAISETVQVIPALLLLIAIVRLTARRQTVPGLDRLRKPATSSPSSLPSILPRDSPVGGKPPS